QKHAASFGSGRVQRGATPPGGRAAPSRATAHRRTARRGRGEGTCTRSSRLPAPEDVEQLVLELRREVLSLKPAHSANRLTHLLEVGHAPVAEAEVLLEPRTFGGREAALEIVG